MGNTVASNSIQIIKTSLTRTSIPMSTMKKKATKLCMSIKNDIEQPKEESTKMKLLGVLLVQTVCLCWKAYREIVKEDERVFLIGKEKKARTTVLKYLKPLETEYCISDLEKGFDAVKCTGITNLVTCGTSNKAKIDGDMIWQRSNAFYQLFSVFCHRNKLDNLMEEVKAKKRKTTLLICIPSNTIRNSGAEDFIRENNKLIGTFDRCHLVITDCNCNCNFKCFTPQNFPKSLRKISTKSPIFHGIDGSGIGTPLFFLKYTGNLNFEAFALDSMIVFVSLYYCLNYKKMIKTILKNVFKQRNPMSKWRCYNCATNKQNICKYSCLGRVNKVLR